MKIYKLTWYLDTEANLKNPSSPIRKLQKNVIKSSRKPFIVDAGYPSQN